MKKDIRIMKSGCGGCAGKFIFWIKLFIFQSGAGTAGAVCITGGTVYSGICGNTACHWAGSPRRPAPPAAAGAGRLGECFLSGGIFFGRSIFSSELCIFLFESGTGQYLYQSGNLGLHCGGDCVSRGVFYRIAEDWVHCDLDRSLSV